MTATENLRVVVDADADPLVREMNRAEMAVKGFSRITHDANGQLRTDTTGTGRLQDQAAKNTTRGFQAQSKGAGLMSNSLVTGAKSWAKFAGASAAAAGASIVIRRIAQDTVAFDRAMRNVNSIAQLNEEEFGKLEQAVLGLAGPTAQAPETLAEGLYALVSSGFKANDAVKILGVSAKAATAGLTDTGTATKAVAAVLNAYHLKVEDSAHVSDLLFQTVNRGVLTFEELSSQIGDVLPFAAQLHVGFDQVGAAISTMTKEGLSGADATTRLKQTIVGFIKPTDDMTAVLKDLGYESGAQIVQQKGFQGALEAVTEEVGGSQQAIAKLFPDVRGLGGALALTGENAKSAGVDLKFMADAGGATDKALSQQSQSISYQWNKLKAEASALSIKVGFAFIKIVRDIANAKGTVGRSVHDIGIFLGPILERIISGVKAMFAGMFKSVASAMKLIGDLLHGRWSEIWRDVRGIFEGFLQWLGGVTKLLLTPLMSAAKVVDIALTGAFGGMWRGIKGVFVDGANVVIDVLDELIGVISSIPFAPDIGKVGHIFVATGTDSSKSGQGLDHQHGTNKARGGVLAGSGLADTVPVMAAPGEAFINRHQQRPVEAAMAASAAMGVQPYGSLGALFAGEQRPHYMARGGVAQHFAGGGAVNKGASYFKDKLPGTDGSGWVGRFFGSIADALISGASSFITDGFDSKKFGKFTGLGAAGSYSGPLNRTFPHPGGPTISFDQAAWLAEKAGLPGVTYAQIAIGESGLRPGAVSPDGGYGLWQMTPRVQSARTIAKWNAIGSYFNPWSNALMAKVLAGSGTGTSNYYGTGAVTDWNKHYRGKPPKGAFARGGLVRRAVQRLAGGGMVDPSWDPGGEVLDSSISRLVGTWAKRYRADMTAGYDPGGGHVSPGHNVTGTATDMIPGAGGSWNRLEKGLALLVGKGFEVGYDGSVGTQAWPDHGRGNHAHIEWAGNGTAGDARERLRSYFKRMGVGKSGGGGAPEDTGPTEAELKKREQDRKARARIRQRLGTLSGLRRNLGIKQMLGGEPGSKIPQLLGLARFWHTFGDFGDRQKGWDALEKRLDSARTEQAKLLVLHRIQRFTAQMGEEEISGHTVEALHSERGPMPGYDTRSDRKAEKAEREHKLEGLRFDMANADTPKRKLKAAEALRDFWATYGVLGDEGGPKATAGGVGPAAGGGRHEKARAQKLRRAAYDPKLTGAEHLRAVLDWDRWASSHEEISSAPEDKLRGRRPHFTKTGQKASELAALRLEQLIATQKELRLSQAQYGVIPGLLAELKGSFLGAFASGIDWVPRDGLAVLHHGEAVLPAEVNRERLVASAPAVGAAPVQVSLTLADKSGELVELIDARVDGHTARIVSTVDRHLGRKARRIAVAPGRA